MNLSKELKALEDSKIRRIHYDVMDGHFVPNLSFGPGILKQIADSSNLTVDVHLMVNNPTQFINSFIEAGASTISIHIENTTHIHKDITHIKKHNIKAGVVLNPGTAWQAIIPILPFIDHVLFMSVNPGFGGQKMIMEVLDKIKEFKNYLLSTSYKPEIAIDGGVNKENIKKVLETGCNVAIIGNDFFKEKNYKTALQNYESLLEKQ